MKNRRLCSLAFIVALFLHLASSQSFNPSILQDSRDLPKVDGTFGFLYRTEDGIAHAAKGDSNGVVHGRFSYTDPTGLKVNYNYNAGSRFGPQDQQEPQNGPARQYQQPKTQYQPRQEYQQPKSQYRAPQEYQQPQFEYEESPQYVEPQQEYVPQTRPSSRVQRPSRPQYSARYRESVDTYTQRRTRPYANHNEVYDYGN